MQDLKTSLPPGNEDRFESLPPSPATSEKEWTKNEEFEPTLNETKEGATGGQIIAPVSEMDSKDEFDSLINRLEIDSSAGEPLKNTMLPIVFC